MRHKREGPAQIFPRHCRHIDAIQQYATDPWFKKPQQKLKDRGFPGAGRADKRHRFPGTNGQRQIIERGNLWPGRIGKAHGVKFDGTGNPIRQQVRRDRVHDRVDCFQQLDQSLCCSGGALQFAPDFRHSSHSTGHQNRINHELHQFPGAHGSGTHVPCTDPKHPDNASEDQKDHDHRHQRPGGDPLFGDIECPFGKAAKTRPALCLMGIGLNRLRGEKRFGCLGGTVGNPILAFTAQPAQSPAQRQDRHNDQRHNQQHQRRQFRRSEQHENQATNQDQHIARRHRNRRRDHRQDQRGVRGQPRQDLTCHDPLKKHR